MEHLAREAVGVAAVDHEEEEEVVVEAFEAVPVVAEAVVDPARICREADKGDNQAVPGVAALAEEVLAEAVALEEALVEQGVVEAAEEVVLVARG